MNQIDLEYLTNPIFKKQQQETELIKLDIDFYKYRILSLTKQLLDNQSINKNIDHGFRKYVNMCIEHFKFIDKKDIIQQKYLDLPKKQPKKYTNDTKQIVNNADKVIFFKPTRKTKDIAEVLNIKPPEKKPFMPEKLTINYKSQHHRMKDVQKNNMPNKYIDEKTKKKKKAKKKDKKKHKKRKKKVHQKVEI